jgi:hypothetical protein
MFWGKFEIVKVPIKEIKVAHNVSDVENDECESYEERITVK